MCVEPHSLALFHHWYMDNLILIWFPLGNASFSNCNIHIHVWMLILAYHYLYWFLFIVNDHGYKAMGLLRRWNGSLSQFDRRWSACVLSHDPFSHDCYLISVLKHFLITSAFRLWVEDSCSRGLLVAKLNETHSNTGSFTYTDSLFVDTYTSHLHCHCLWYGCRPHVQCIVYLTVTYV